MHGRPRRGHSGRGAYAHRRRNQPGQWGAHPPIKQEGSVVTHIHPDIHELTGSFQGLVTEFARLNVDADRGYGVFSADGDFGGTVLGSEPGTAKVKLRAQVADFHMLEGRFVITRGRDGLAGVRATGTWRYVFGEGGSYEGRAYIRH